MDDVMGKLGELLSDEESVRQLSELAEMMMTEGQSKSEDGVEAAQEGTPDLSSILKLSGLLGAASQKDRHTELLLALRPHLKEEKQKRVDKALKLLKLIAVWNMAKESGLLNDMI